MTAIVDITEMRTRCPRCGAGSTVQSAIEVRPGSEYLTLRCTSCALVFDAQVSKAEGNRPFTECSSARFNSAFRAHDMET